MFNTHVVLHTNLTDFDSLYAVDFIFTEDCQIEFFIDLNFKNLNFIRKEPSKK